MAFVKSARRALALASVCAVLAVAPASAQSLAEGSIAEAVQALKPGQYLWAPQVAPAGPMLIVVNLRTQRLIAYRNGIPIGVSTVSTGRAGHTTPTGVFSVLQKQVHHRSNIYSNAPMPYMQRLTWGGIALHGGHLPGYPASHGCIRLPHAFARLLFGETDLGMTVVITDRTAVPRIAPRTELFGGVMPEPDARYAAPPVWRPQLAPAGPVSVVISAADGRMVVLRNGVEIGSAPVQIGAPLDHTSVFALQSADDNGFHWLSVPLPGQTAEPEAAPDWGHIQFDRDFHTALAGVLTPGAVVVVTRDSLRTGGTGARVTVIEDDMSVPDARLKLPKR